MADNIKISALNELVSGSIVGTTIIPTVNGGVTLKAQMSSIKAFTNSDVATDTKLANEVSTLNNTIGALTTSDISEGTNKYYTDVKVKTKLDAEGVLSGSLPAGYTLEVGGVSSVNNITFTGATVTDNTGGSVGVTINTTDLAVNDGSTTVSSVESITFTGATATDGGTGNVGISIVTSSLAVSATPGPLDVDNVTKITFDGGNVADNGSGEITVTIATDLTGLNTFTGSLNTFTG